jgi:DsbC/DsbD-like thiol-disulfide interchange protein
VPPVAIFDGSTNLAEASMRFPAPGRFDEGGVEALGYMDGVVFPVVVVPVDPGRPVRLALSLSFAVCAAQCLPVNARTALVLGGNGATPEAGLVKDAMAHVPARRILGEAGTLVIEAISGSAAQDTVSVTARADGDDSPSLFIEAPDPWYMQAGSGLRMSDGRITFPIRILSKPSEAAVAPVPVRLTLVGREGAIDVSASLDAAPPKP